MTDSESCLELSATVHSLLFAIRSSQYWDSDVLRPSHVYWLGCLLGHPSVPAVVTESDVLRWLCLHHADGFPEFENALNEVSRDIVPFYPAISNVSKVFGIDPPTHYANFHQYALAWLREYIRAWQVSWSECLNPFFPHITNRDPREDFHHVTYSEHSYFGGSYPWPQMQHAAETAPPSLWQRLIHGYGLFNTITCRQDFPFESFAREANCLKQTPSDTLLRRRESAGNPTIVAIDVEKRTPETLVERGERGKRPPKPDQIKRNADEVIRKADECGHVFESCKALADAVGCSRSGGAIKEVWKHYRKKHGKVAKPKAISLTHDVAVDDAELKRLAEIESLRQEQETESRAELYGRRPQV